VARAASIAAIPHDAFGFVAGWEARFSKFPPSLIASGKVDR